MTGRNLDYLLKPSSVALIGASDRPSSLGAAVLKNLRDAAFAGPIMPVNPKHAEIGGARCYVSIADLPTVPDLAVVVTPPDTIPGIIAALGERGCKAAVVISAGFAEDAAGRGPALQQAMLDAARPHTLRIVGPNCLGVISPRHQLNATFAPVGAKPGSLALVTQSGAIMTGILDWASARNIGFSHLVSVGAMADVDFGDLLDYLAQDAGTAAILLYVEALTHARKFMSAARAASRNKPVIVLKAGRHPEGARAVASHTGALAGVDAVYSAAFHRAGMLRVGTLREMFDAAELLSGVTGRAAPLRGDRLAILSNGGGFGVLATDSLMDEGGRLADLTPATIAALDAVLPSGWSHGNPVDILGDASGQRYGDALAALLGDSHIDAVLALYCPTALTTPMEAAKPVAATLKRSRTPLMACWVGDSPQVAEARHFLETEGVPAYDTPGDAVTAFMHLVRYGESRRALMETPPSMPREVTPDRAAVRAVIDRALAEGRPWLGEAEAKAVFAAYGIPVATTRIAAGVDEAVAAAKEIGFPVALKIVSRDIVHKSEVGGVVLDLGDEEQVRNAATSMLARVAGAAPDAAVEGFSVQSMIRRPHSWELIVGATEDPQFGPVILFGQGGTSANVVADRALALPPLNMRLAHDLMGQTRVHRLLRGYRDCPPADLDAIAVTLIKVAQLVIDMAEIVELDINPLLGDDHGVIALDGRIRVARTALPAEQRLAIRPYPCELEEEIELADGRMLLLRPIRPEDERALIAAFRKLSPEAVRLRFFAPVKELTHETAAGFTQIDYDRQMALVLTDRETSETAQIYAVGRLSADPDNAEAEFALTVRDDMTGMGLSMLLMRRLIDYARRRGIGRIVGHVLRENKAMLGICRLLGFEESADPDDRGIRTVTLRV
jgi:acetyltransferase